VGKNVEIVAAKQLVREPDGAKGSVAALGARLRPQPHLAPVAGWQQKKEKEEENIEKD
jgi:hypothetical protein